MSLRRGTSGSWVRDALVLYIEDRTRGNSLLIEKRHSHRMPKSEFYGNVLCIGLGLRLSIQAIATISLRYSADEPLVSLTSTTGVADLEDTRGGAGAYA